MSDDYQRVEAHDCPMSTCAVPPGSPCRTTKGRVAVQYHTARFRLVPSLAKALNVPVPPVRKPGTAWVELPRPAGVGPAPAGHVRIGYARASTARQSLDTQLDSLAAAGTTRVFSEKISTRATKRPELEKAVTLAREIRASGVAVTLVVHEHKRLGRGMDLAVLAEELRASDIGLQFLTGDLQGSHDPGGVVFTVLAALSGMEREYIRDRTLEGHESARRRGKTIGGANVTDDAMLAMALHLREQDMSLRDIAARLVITKGAKRGQHPSPATVMRLLREHDTRQAAVTHAPPGIPERQRQAAPAVTDASLTAPSSEQPAPPTPAAAESPASSARADSEPAPDNRAQPAHAATAPTARRRSPATASRDDSAPLPTWDTTAIKPVAQKLPKKRAQAVIDAAELVRAPDYRESHMWVLRSGDTLIGYVVPSYGGVSRSGRNGWTSSLGGTPGPRCHSRDGAKLDLATRWLRVVTAAPRRTLTGRD